VFVFIVLSIVSACGVACLLFLKNLREEVRDDEAGDALQKQKRNKGSESALPEESEKAMSTAEDKVPAEPKTSLQLATDALVQAVKLFITPYMLLLSVASVYTGWGQCFFFGVYSTSVGATLQFNDPKKLVGLIGIFTGIGEVAGGTVFGLLGSKTTKKGRSPVVFLGLMVHTLCYILIYLNLPNESPIRATNDVSVINPPQAWLALVGALLLGFGDACYQTQLFAIFGSVYSDKSAAAFAIFKFTQSAASAIAFLSSSYMGIFDQMLTLLITAILGFMGIFVVEVHSKRKANKASSSQEEAGGAGGDGVTEEESSLKNDKNSNSVSSP